MVRLKAYVKEVGAELRGQLFKRSIASRVMWGLASLVTFGFAYWFTLIGGPGGTLENPFANPFNQFLSAFSTVGWVVGGFGTLYFVVLGLDNPKKKED